MSAVRALPLATILLVVLTAAARTTVAWGSPLAQARADITVVVRDEHGAPVVDAAVFATRLASASGSLCLDAIMGDRYRTTDEDGRCEIHDLDVGYAYYVGVHVGDARLHGWPTSTCAENGLLTIVRVRTGVGQQVLLRPAPDPAVVEGQVRFRGAPVPRARVSAGAAAAAVPLIGTGATTDERGRFRLELARAGEYRFSVRRECPQEEDSVSFPERSFMREVVAGSGNSELMIELPDRGVRGVVRDTEGRPIVGIPVRARRVGPLGFWESSSSDRSDEEGRFELAGLDPGPWILRCGGGRRADARERTFAPIARELHLTGELDHRTVDIELGDCARLSGLVVDDAGEPVAGAEVFWRHAGSVGRWRRGIPRTDTRGGFVLECAPDSAVELYAASAAGLASARTVTAEPGQLPRVVLTAAGRIYLACKGRGGDARAVAFSVRSARGHDVPLPPLTRAYVYEVELEALAPGRYTFGVTTFEGRVVRREFEIRNVDGGNRIVLGLP